MKVVSFITGLVIALLLAHPAFSQQAARSTMYVEHFISLLEHTRPENTIVLDVRTPEEASLGRFKGSVLIPLKDLHTRYRELPQDADIVIHCSDGRRAEQAYRLLTAKGHASVWFLRAEVSFAADGSYSLTELKEGQISIAAFKHLLETRPAGLILLDVRTRKEAETGSIKGVRLYPLEELMKSRPEFPHDAEIVIHCAYGSRAWQAYEFLKRSGYSRVRYLIGTVAFLPDGSYRISK